MQKLRVPLVFSMVAVLVALGFPSASRADPIFNGNWIQSSDRIPSLAMVRFKPRANAVTFAFKDFDRSVFRFVRTGPNLNLLGRTYIEHSAIFSLQIQPSFNLDRLSDVDFLYGTSHCESRTASVPESSSLMLFGFGLLAL